MLEVIGYKAPPPTRLSTLPEHQQLQTEQLQPGVSHKYVLLLMPPAHLNSARLRANIRPTVRPLRCSL
jgi:hypothetical protein